MVSLAFGKKNSIIIRDGSRLVTIYKAKIKGVQAGGERAVLSVKQRQGKRYKQIYQIFFNADQFEDLIKMMAVVLGDLRKTQSRLRLATRNYFQGVMV